jgi:hypothetical protein
MNRQANMRMDMNTLISTQNSIILIEKEWLIDNTISLDDEVEIA